MHIDIIATLADYAGYNTMLRVGYRKIIAAYCCRLGIIYKKYRFVRSGNIYLGPHKIYSKINGRLEYCNYLLSSRLYKCILFYRYHKISSISMYSIDDRDNIKITIFYHLIKRKIRIKVYIDGCNRIIYKKRIKKLI